MIQYKLGSQVPFSASNLSCDTFIIFVGMDKYFTYWFCMYTEQTVIFNAVNAVIILQILHEVRK